jgi:hypothetical protein
MENDAKQANDAQIDRTASQEGEQVRIHGGASLFPLSGSRTEKNGEKNYHYRQCRDCEV